MEAPFQLHLGDCLAVLKTLPDNSVDSIVTDPPYGLSKEPDMAEVLSHWLAGDDYQHTGGGFMGKSWDSFVPGPSVWKECLRVLKPGGHLLAFFGTRTQDIGTLAIRLAGFEIRDSIAWVYGSGFPKSHNLEGDWEGWGTALKPALEPITVARKPFRGTVAANVLAHGTGALNIDACRIETSENLNGGAYAENGRQSVSDSLRQGGGMNTIGASAGEYVQPTGRWPANLIHDGSDEVVALFPHSTSGAMKAGTQHAAQDEPGSVCYGTFGGNITKKEIESSSGSAARFFYSAKASRRDRHEGLEDPGAQFKRGTTLRQVENTETTGNNHPTVKPTDLMAYLLRLVTPPGGVALDPFMGSGSTGKAAMREGFRFIGIERDTDEHGNSLGYMAIARARIEHELAKRPPEPVAKQEPEQQDLFAMA